MMNLSWKKNIRIFAFVMAIIIFGLSFTSTTMSVYASSEISTVGKGGSLYGTGSANELNIVKLLDMALNRGGMSMSPATIKQFLEFWWGAVRSDLSTCIGNVDTSITGTQAFVDALSAALVSAEHYDNLGDIIKKYLSFCMTLEYKSLSDFKQLLTQEGTFRQFLLSYVADEDGNVVGTVDNKLKRYNLKSGLVNMVRKAADAYIEEHEGYYLFPTYTYKDLSPVMFGTKSNYEMFNSFLRSITLGDTILSVYFKSDVYSISIISDPNFVLHGNGYISDDSMYFTVYDSNWNYVSKFPFNYFNSDFVSNYPDIGTSYELSTQYYYYNLPSGSNQYRRVLFSSDGRTVKVWKSLDAFKSFSVGKSNIYYSNQYSGFDYEVDNSVTFDYDYYTSNNYSHTVIQNNIDNSTEVNETTINNIVNNYITNNYYGDGSGDGNGSGGGSGNWFTDLIKGIPELLLALINGLTDILDSVGTLIEKLINLFTDLFVPSDGIFDSVTTKVNEKFTFKDQSETNIRLIFDELPNMGQTAPTITFPFSETTLSKYGLEDVTVSFDWYEPYKPTVDAIFSAILWAMFAFNQYFAIKNIINASGNAVDIATRL